MKNATGVMVRTVLIALLLVLGLAQQVMAAELGETSAAGRERLQAKIESITSGMTTAEMREAAAARKKLERSVSDLISGGGLSAQGSVSAAVVPPPGPGGQPDYFGFTPNWAWTPPLRKFVDGLPGLGSANANNLGQYLSVAHPDTTMYPGSDYYEIELRQYSQKLHSDLPATTLRGYVQVNYGTDALGHNTIPPDPIHYLGPTIVAQKDRPVRVKFTNKLPTGAGGDLFLPVDTTVMGAGMGPLEMNVPTGQPMDYTQNRGTLHLHGGKTVWISDGTPHQWITPAGENTPYPKGVSVKNVSDMPDPGDGSMTFFYSNQQSARMLWYHDHAYGITRLNVYAGEAAGFMLTDATEQRLVTQGVIPSDQIPLIIQDKTFVDASTIATTDPTWNWGTTAPTPRTGDLWFPHVYMPNQHPYDITGANAMGRWDYGPWFFPPTNIAYPPIPNPYYDPVNAPWEPPMMPAVPDTSSVMESFMDTPLINGTAYPSVTLQPKPYRLRILNGSNDRFLNLQLYKADPATQSVDGRLMTEVKMVPAASTAGYPAAWPVDGRPGGVPDPATVGPDFIQIGTEGGFLPAPTIVKNQPVDWNLNPKTFTFGNVSSKALALAPAERADVIVDLSAYAGQTLILYNDAPAAWPAKDARNDYYTNAPDQTDTGGTKGALVGMGPNTRTLMQIKIAAVAPAPAFDMAALNTAFASTVTTPGVFKSSQDPIIVAQAAYNSAYATAFPTIWPLWGYSRIQDTSLTFRTVAGETLTVDMEPKAIHDEMGGAYDQWGRMAGKLGLEVPTGNAVTQMFIGQSYIDPSTENIQDSITAISPVAGDGTQIWKITHNGVDTHPIHFHLFDVQLLNRVGWDGAIETPDPNELGWKETVRVNPLEDTIVALRPISPKLPFGVPDSVRPLDPTQPIGGTMGFTNLDTLTGDPLASPQLNEIVNFGWEYMWHCHILSHEEMEMMRPIIFGVARSLPGTSTMTWTGIAGSPISVTWVDPTPPNLLSTWGNPSNEIGYRIQRATITDPAAAPAYSAIATALANATAYTDATTVGGSSYAYRVVAFNAAGETIYSPPLKTRFEETDSRITYSGPWATTFSSSLSGGSYASGISTATVLVRFDGTGIDLVGTKSRYGGIAEVSVDGGAAIPIDFYAAATAHKQVIWTVSGLTSGPHTVAVTSTVRRNPSSIGGNTYIDAFDVAGTLLQAATRIQQTDAKITWAGAWATNSSPSLSGGSFAGGTPGATMLVRFDGTGVEIIGTLSPYGGIAEVSIDGAAPTDADFYGPATSHKRRIWGISGLTSGPHTIALTVTTRRNASSLGGMAYIDALDVAGTLLQAPVRFQQTDARVGFSGPWTTTSSASLSGGSYVGGTSGAVMTLRFDGTAIDLIGTLSSYGGIATVSVDGAAPVDIDFYGPGTSHKRRVWGISGLTLGAHTVRLTVTSRRNALSLGGNTYVDAFDVFGTLLPARFEQTDALISWTGPWTTTTSPSLSGGSYAGGTSGATLTLHFDGTGIDLVGTKSTYGGIATVSIDGGALADADFYAASTLHKQRIWGVTGLAPGRHTLTLTVTSRRNPFSLGGNAYVDAFDVMGALVP